MASTLPNNPSLDRLREDARRLQRGITTNTPEAVELVRARLRARVCHALPSATRCRIGRRTGSIRAA
jgi:hypothetical protein